MLPFLHRLSVSLAVMALLFLSLSPLPVQANSSWAIDRLHAKITIQEDGLVDITETIAVNFRTERHGIIRQLPYRYAGRDGKDIYTKITVLSVQKNGLGEPFEQQQNKYNLQIKIGDSRIGDLKGQYTYELRYQVEGILLGFSNYDELYWNVVGDQWDTTISQATATVTLPQPGIKQQACYQGQAGSTTECSATVMPTNQEVRFSGTGPINAGQGLTIAVGYDKGMVPLLTVAPPTVKEAVIQYREVIVAALAVSLLGLAAIFLLWYKRGRDWWWQTVKPLQIEPDQAILKPIGAGQPLVVEYTPPQDLTPGLVGLLKDERVDTLDITSTIVDLAARGYLVITQLDKKGFFGSLDYQLDRTAKPDQDLMPYEQMLLASLFKGKSQLKLSSLKEKFYTDLAKIKKELEAEGQRRQFFVRTPSQVVILYATIGILLLLTGIGSSIAVASLLRHGWLLGMCLGLILPGIALIITAFHMPQKTAQGRDLWRQIKGYELFIKNAEQHRQKFFEQQNLFTEVLPYAMVFGLTTTFATAIKNIGLEPQQPDWYRSSTAFNAALFASSMNTLSNSVSTAIASAPSSSGSGGGGSSGGGFGGGGGSSW